MADPRPELQWIAEQQGASRAALLHLAQINSGSFNADGVAAVAEAGLPLHGLTSQRSSLDDVFLSLTGHTAAAPEGEDANPETDDLLEVAA